VGRQQEAVVSQFSIIGFVGLNGHGKTLAMVDKLALPAFRKGVRVVSNFRLYPARLGFPDDLFVPLGTWRNIIRSGVHVVTLEPHEVDQWEPQYRRFASLIGHDQGAVDGQAVRVTEEGHLEVPRLNRDGSLYSITNNQRAVLLLDEINAVLPSRSYQSMPPELLRVINQLRKHDVTLGWTAPAWERADKTLREVTSAVWLCRGYLSDGWERDPYHRAFRPRVKRDEAGKRIRWAKGWPPRRVFAFRLYNAADFEEFSLQQATDARIRAMAVQWYWRSRHDAQVAYGSQDGVMLLDHLDAFTGSCVHCDGSKTRHKCKCTPESIAAKYDTAQGEHDGQAEPAEGSPPVPTLVPIFLPADHA
jgi:hypothetical protein